MRVNLRSPLLIGWHKNPTPCVVFVTLVMGKGNAPVLGSGRTCDFGETKSENRSSRQPTIQEIVPARVPPESHPEPWNVFWKTRSELSLRDSSRGLASGVESAIHGQDCPPTRSILHKPSLMALIPFRFQPSPVRFRLDRRTRISRKNQGARWARLTLFPKRRKQEAYPANPACLIREGRGERE